MNKSEYIMNWRNRTKQKLVEYKGGKCQVCGYDKPIWNVYDFHHRDASKKDFTISGKSWSLDRLKEEVDKCDLLCRNCHAEFHWDETQGKRNERLKIIQKVNSLPMIVCKFCGKEVRASWLGAKCCSLVCARVIGRKVERPSLEVLMKELQELSWVDVGKKYGVSDNSVRKWAKRYGIYDLIIENKKGR